MEEIERSSWGFRVELVVGKGGARGMSSDPRPENVWPLARNPNTPDKPVDVLGRGSRACPLVLP